MMLRLEGVTKHFVGRRGTVRALEDVTLDLPAGGSLALVGESGCGKTTLTRLVLRVERPTAGRILFDGQDVAALSGRVLQGFRRAVGAVFQDPYASLNPRLRVGVIVAEPILAHERPGRAALRERVAEVLGIVGLPPESAGLYPHEFSGGQRQRVAIARALALRPRLLVLDEPVSALDVSIRAQVLNLLADIRAAFGLTYLTVAHDLALVAHFSRTVAVIHLGRVVEAGPTDAVFAAPAHPYTRALLEAVPQPDPDLPAPALPMEEEAGSAMDMPSGCSFHPRCRHVMPICRTTVPAPRSAGADRRAACHLLPETDMSA
jgi:oligopeptide/dipeptide ABC transporter ATP-binding protein